MPRAPILVGPHCYGFDPGARSIAFAGVDINCEVIHAGYEKWDGSLDEALHKAQDYILAQGLGMMDYAVVEVPRIYQGRTSEKDQNDVVDVAVMAGAIIETCRFNHAAVYRVHPHAWKGNLPKKIHHTRIKERLSKHSLDVVNRAMLLIDSKLRHNVWDAVGLALHARDTFIRSCKNA